jgi:glycosyltransferase involved in cell wall biosynthesis
MITVLLTAFNRKQFLLDALYSVISQSLDSSKHKIIIP